MTPRSKSSDGRAATEWSEERVERLLERYFLQEMPPELRAPDLPSAIRQAVASPTVRPAPRSVPRWVLPMCSAALIGAVWVLGRSSFAPPRVDSAPPQIVEVETTSLPVMTDRVSFAGTHDRYEQRSELRWTSESYFEPATGEWVEWTAPELVIDVETLAGREGGLP